MRNTLETRLGIFVALAVIAAVLIVETLGGFEVVKSGKYLIAPIHNIQDLKKGDRVKMAGYDIGRVVDITLDTTNNRVNVLLKLNKDAAVKSDSVATIRFTGLMGQNFIAVEFGSPGAPLLTDKMQINTTEATDLAAIMQKLDNVAAGVENVTKSFSGFKISTLVGPLIDLIQTNQLPLSEVISNMNMVSRQVAAGEGTIGKLIFDTSATNLYNTAIATVSNLQETATEIRTTVEDARKVVAQVNAGEGTIGRLVKDEALYRETTNSMTTLREILQKMNQGQGTVSKILNDPDLYNNAKLTMRKLDMATEGLEDQGPLSIMGILVGKLF
jgi:phospholipid/cholesterol/gamma-HCH transport system substrate-binding protein